MLLIGLLINIAEFCTHSIFFVGVMFVFNLNPNPTFMLVCRPVLLRVRFTKQSHHVIGHIQR